ncbi:MAG: ABC transporter substrate-binding protein [Candidatus Cloacimonadota bacterium]|nr:MAG: ABC transporter substrate-binding protein [Candidatus Cloacimonadota bacterium]RLC54049.1 MAG: ABC transporter substrate-binding protein [Candidatus Cloacimonadota bacterium]
MKNVLIIIAVASLLLISCGKKTDVKSDVTEVIFWQAMGGPLGDALAELVDEFNETHPHIFVNSINMGNYTALSQKLMASIQTGNQPHVAQAYEAWISNFVDGDVIIPVQDFIDADPDFGDEDLADIYPVFIESNTMKGKLVSFPFNKSVRVQYYNKDILFQNDLDPNKPPVTWDDFTRLSKLLTQDLDGDGKIDQYGTTIKISAWQFENLLLQAGGEIMTPDNKTPLFNSKEGVEALDYLNNLLNGDKSAYLSPGYEGQKDFTARKIAFYEDSSVSMAYMLRTGIDFNLGISAIPIKESKRNIISGTNVVIFDSNEEKVEQAAWEFVKWFTDAKQTARWSELTYYMPVRKSAFQEEAIKNRIESNPEIASVYEQLEYATFEPQISEWFETRKYLEEHVIEKVVRGTLTPQKALDNAVKLIEEKIAKTAE